VIRNAAALDNAARTMLTEVQVDTGGKRKRRGPSSWPAGGHSGRRGSPWVQDVAQAYFQLRSLDAQLEITREHHQGPAGLSAIDTVIGAIWRRLPGRHPPGGRRRRIYRGTLPLVIPRSRLACGKLREE
jgi:hypothetical protein